MPCSLNSQCKTLVLGVSRRAAPGPNWNSCLFLLPQPFPLASAGSFVLHFRCHINRENRYPLPWRRVLVLQALYTELGYKARLGSFGFLDNISISGYTTKPSEGPMKVLCDTVLPKASFCQSTLCLERRLYPLHVIRETPGTPQATLCRIVDTHVPCLRCLLRGTE
jgi:hypothetical protein